MNSESKLAAGDRAALANAPRRPGYPTAEQEAFKKETSRISQENAWMAAPVLGAVAAPLMLQGVPLAAAGATSAAKFIARGGELSIGKDFRIAPFGNRTSNPYGRVPHYHRRAPLIDGKSPPGQGLSRHRPWETKTPDKSFWDRF